MRTPQPKGEKGSLKWIQELINNNSDLFNKRIQNHIKDDLSLTEWVSPKKEDDFAEYRDNDFLEVLEIKGHQSRLHDFWPKRGPQWDALGKVKDKFYFIVEAKANIPEITSSCQSTSENSKTKIKNSIMRTRQFLNATSGHNWLNGFYQYANRLCHLYFLRELCGINAYLIFVYFCNDTTHIPTSIEQWNGAIKLQKHLMSLSRHQLQQYIIEIFIDIEEIGTEQNKG
jgi:hypothetical protein